MAGGDHQSGAGGARPLHDVSDAHSLLRERVASAAVDLFLPPRSRLTDYQRSTAAQLLDALVAEIEHELRAELAPGLRQAAAPELAAIVAADHKPIAGPILMRAGALRDPALLAILLRRADEQLLSDQLRAAREPGEASPGPLDGWRGGANPIVAEAAAALLRAEARRIGPARQPRVPRADLPAELQHRLLWLVAAGMRHHLVGACALDAGDADRLLRGAAVATLSGYDEDAGHEAAAMRLARAVVRDDDAAVQALVEAGDVAIAAALLCERARIGWGDALDMLIEPGARGAALLSGAGVAAEHAVAILIRIALARGGDEDEAVAQAEGYATLDRDAVEQALRPWRLDRDFRAAIEAVADGLARDGIG